jgi:hypothetical protein
MTDEQLNAILRELQLLLEVQRGILIEIVALNNRQGRKENER